jgi:SAM-dependent methyltransferase
VTIEDPDYKHIEETYDEGCQDYGDHFKNPHEFIEPDRQQFLARRPTGSSILDCGCGAGMDTERFSYLGYNVTAIDLSDRFVSLVRQRVPGVRIEKMDMRQLSFPKASFDGVWASFSLLHIRANELEKTLSNFQSVLREGGLFFAALHRGPETKWERLRSLEWSAIPTFRSGCSLTLKRACAEPASRSSKAALS